MKTLLLLALLFPCAVLSAPFLVADIDDPASTTCVYTNNAGAVSTSPVVVDPLGLPANGGRICKVDLASSSTGTNNIKLRARGLWGDSVDVPFTFARPASISLPATLRLAP